MSEAREGRTTMRFLLAAADILLGILIVYLGFIQRQAIDWDRVAIGSVFLVNAAYLLVARSNHGYGSAIGKRRR